MKCLIILTAALVAISSSTDYEQALQSPEQLKALFSEYTSKYAQTYSAAEAPLRIRIFRADLKRVIQLNKEKTWTSGLNAFSAMTQAEKAQYLGLNVTEAAGRKEVAAPAGAGPSSTGVDWRKRGKVTGIKDQGGCGSCWTFSAVGAVETNYAIRTGRRKQFAEQEYLDCTYDKNSGRDGCQGGWYYEAWRYSKESGRLATADAVTYTAKDGACAYSRVHNGLQAAVITGTQNVPKGERNVLSYLDSGAVAVAYEVSDDFFKYKEGIIRDNSCSSWVNHAVTAVGYTRGAMIVRNSWGQWGMKGYFYTARNHAGCQIYDMGAVPTWSSTGRADTDPEYVPSDDDDCDGTNSDGCPCGTVRCSDGACRHAHMC